MKTTVLMPARAPAAATALARLPVEGQAKTLLPNSRAALSAQATTRSLKELVGLVESSLTQRLSMPSSRPRLCGLEQPGEAGLGVGALLDVVGHRQQRLVAPDVARAGLDLLAGDGREVVGDLERPEALRTRVVGAELDLVPALATGQGAWRCRRRPRGGPGSWLPCSADDGAHGVLLLIFPAADSRPGPELAPFPRLPGVSVTGGSWRLPGLHRAVPSVPLDELCTTLRSASHDVYTGPHAGGMGRPVVRDGGRRRSDDRRGLSAGRRG